VIKTLVDFSDRRPLIWRETSHPEGYRLHSLTATGADVTEGVAAAGLRLLETRTFSSGAVYLAR